MKQQYKILRLILGDQLNIQHSWYKETSSDTLYVMMEVLSETNYVRHHVQKITGFFLAMRAFSNQLKADGHEVCYMALDADENEQTFAANIKKIVEQYQIEYFEYQLPDEYRLDQHLKELCETLTIETKAVDTEHFMVDRGFVADLFAKKKRYLLESFYRNVRKQYQIMMEDDGKTPLTGQWNYDKNNRNKYPENIEIPAVPSFEQDATSILQLLEAKQVKTIGNIDAAHFDCPITRAEALDLLKHFNEQRLQHFGDYQDAMSDRHWLGFHSRLSFVLNVKLISPLEVVNATIEYWQQHQAAIDISQVEGFVRQIIGWREYMRGIYWAKMPEYAQLNHFNHQAALPKFYWTGDTKMKCLSHAIRQSLDYAYAHHIQRLMLTGNFALLLGVHPDEVDAWYLGIYMDALEWVEITNTRGMSQYADGGIVGTKPYVSSANYIDKMSDYCKNCYYDKKKKYGEKACPFNSLYWDFYDRNSDKLSRVPRINMMLGTWNKMNVADKTAILEQAAYYKSHTDEL